MSKRQQKLLAVLAALVAGVALIAASLAERGLRRNQLDQAARSLEARAALVRDRLGDRPLTPAASRALDDLAEAAAASAGARVTLIAPDGTVVADSAVPSVKLERMASHGDRPEVQAAFAGQVGRSSRRSATLGQELLYVALPIDGGRGGAVRLATATSEVAAAVGALRRELLAAAVLGILASVALCLGIAWLSLRPLRELRRTAAAIAEGRLADRPPLRPSPELKEISDALEQMAEQLALRLDETTEEKERLQAVLNAMVEGVLVVDARREIILANQRLRELFHVRGELAGRTPLETLRHADLDAVLAETEATDLPVSHTLFVGTAAPRTVRVHAVRFPAGSEPRHGTVAVLHDVTEIARLDQVRRDFVANASHELRTPLAAIRGFTETLLSGHELGEADRRSYLEIIDRHARRLGNLVGDLLELSRIESRGLRLEHARLDVAPIARRLVEESRKRTDEKSLKLSVECRGESAVWADPQAIEQILLNLLDNAIQYTNPGGCIEVRIEGDERQVRTSVADDGIGIPKRDLERIFERFYRVDKARSRALGGTGLGLSIVKHLVQNLGGEITVESEIGRGSTFTFSLPGAKSGETA